MTEEEKMSPLARAAYVKTTFPDVVEQIQRDAERDLIERIIADKKALQERLDDHSDEDVIEAWVARAIISIDLEIAQLQHYLPDPPRAP